MNKTVLAAMGVALACLAAGGAALAQQEPPPVKVVVSRVERQMMAPQLQVPGTVISRNDARIAAEISGRITWIAEAGTMVETGDVLARIDDTFWKLEHLENGSVVKRLEVRLKFLGQDVGRLVKLAASNNIPARRLEEAISDRDMTAQDLIQAEINLRRSGYRLERTEVRAPFPGRVVERLLERGEYSTAGSEVVRLVDTTHIEVRAQAPVGVAPFLRDGQVVAVRGGETLLETPIRSIIPVADETSRTFEIRVSLPASMWVIGSAVKVGLPTAKPRQVVAVPRDALILRSDGTYVFKINKENIAKRINVAIGAASGNFVEVAGPVAAGDRVVIRGGERLREGQKVSATTGSRET